MKKPWRIIIDNSADGYWNMAADETLLSVYQHTQEPIMRIYGWQEPFVTLGYAQSPSAVLRQPHACLYTRRLTGGAAIFHHRELTYSFVCRPADVSLPKNIKESYQVLAGFLKTFYAKLGLQAEFACDTVHGATAQRGVYCSANREDFDIVIDGRKVGGNAQRRTRGLIFQHGSIPYTVEHAAINELFFDTSVCMRDAAGLIQLGIEPCVPLLRQYIVESFSEVFRAVLVPSRFCEKELESISRCAVEKYAADWWRFGEVSGAQACVVT